MIFNFLCFFLNFIFRDDSSFNFMVFFFVFFFQMIVSALYSVGIGGIYKKKFIITICFSSNFYFFFRNGFKWTVAGIRSHRKKRSQWWPNFCWGSDGHYWGWMGTGSFGRFLSIGQGAYLTAKRILEILGIQTSSSFVKI